MDRRISAAKSVHGTLRLPGDKSISHRYAMLAAVAEGRTEIDNYSTGADCSSTLECLRAMGLPLDHSGNRVVIEGAGPGGLAAPEQALDAGNSGSTIRMLSGILAGQPFESQIGGDESLSRRPMARIIAPLEQMGALIGAQDGGRPPLKIRGGNLRPIEYHLPVASAQVKTAVLFAGMFADGRTTVHEPLPARNHSEIALREFGADLQVDRLSISIAGRTRLRGQRLRVPADLSSAAFFIAAALLLPGSHLTLEGVGLNPTRAALLDVLRGMGADLKIARSSTFHGELVGDIEVRCAAAGPEPALAGGVIDGATTAGVIDEIPVLAVLGALSREGLTIRDAAELRVKETDRIQTVAGNLQRMGIEVQVHDDGMTIAGRQRFQAAKLDSFGDHRIAMAFAVAALCADGPSVIENAEAASVSFPEFYDLLDDIRAPGVSLG